MLKNIIRSHPIISLIFALFVVAGMAAMVLAESIQPDFFIGITNTLGVEGSVVLFVLFFALLLIFGYFLFNVSYIAVFVFAVLLIIEIGYGAHLVNKVVKQQVHNYIQQLVNQTADLVKVEANSRLKARIFALNHLGTTIGLSDKSPLEQDWEKDANQIVKLFPGFQAVEWVDSEYKVRWVAPLEGNEEFLYQKIHNTEENLAVLEQVKKTRTALFSDSMDLKKGGKGFLLYTPVFRDGEFYGYLVGIINYDSLFDVLFADDVVPGYSISAFVEDEKVYERGEQDPGLQKRWSHEVNFDYQNLDFRFHIWPDRQLVGQEGRIIGSTLIFIGVLIILLMLMALGLVLLMQRANKRLQKEMLAKEQAEAAREQMKKAMMQSQKLEAIGTLAGGIAHNFNNLLYAIKGYVTMARQDVEVGSLLHQNLGKVLEAGQRGQDLVNGILSFSRRDNADQQPVCLKKIIDGALDLLRSTLPASIELEIDLQIEQQQLKGNYTQMQQVIINLIRNAVDAMDAKGVVKISAEIESRSDYLKTLHPGLLCAPYFMVKVLDHGPGIEEAVLDRIFEPFFTTKDIDKGTGLGLATVRSIVEDHEGVVIVQSEVGSGSCFMVLLPVLCGAEQKGSKK